jgi:hypothetical protein
MHGDGNRCDLVKWMLLGGGLQIAWIMFDHVKRVKEWMTLIGHVYVPIYCKMMTNVVCDMQFKDTYIQCVLWWKLNNLMAKNDVPNTNFKGLWLLMPPIGTQCELCMVMRMQMN